MWVGVDVLRSRELDRLLGRPWFRAYAYAREELAAADSFGASRATEFLTGRFAAKEAVSKALGTGFGRGGVSPRQVAVLRDGRGAPAVVLSGRARALARELGMAGVHVSITHKDGLCFAAAIGVPER